MWRGYGCNFAISLSYPQESGYGGARAEAMSVLRTGKVPRRWWQTACLRLLQSR